MGVAAAVARLATRRGGRAALLRAGAPEGRLLPPRGGRHAQVMIERALAEGVARDGNTVVTGALARALVQAGRVARRPGLVVVVSDFREEGWRGPLAALSARHSVIAVEVRDPREASLPGLVTSRSSIPRPARWSRSTAHARACANATPRSRPSAARRWPPGCAPPAPTTSCSTPGTTGCASSGAGSIAGGGAAPLAQRRRTNRARRPANELRRAPLPARPARRSHGHRPAPARPTSSPPLRGALPGRADRRARHSRRQRAGAATSRPPCSRSRPPASSSPSRGPRRRWPCRSSRPRSCSSPTLRAR